VFILKKKNAGSFVANERTRPTNIDLARALDHYECALNRYNNVPNDVMRIDAAIFELNMATAEVQLALAKAKLGEDRSLKTPLFNEIILGITQPPVIIGRSTYV
jgi:hypothetical protein